jgi:uncharacterized membrane protein
MRSLVMIHVAAGGLGLVAGAVALYAAKGAKLHRQSGMAFVYSMLAMAILGAGMAALRQKEGTVIAGVLTTYLVTTGLLTVRAQSGASRSLERGAMVLALSLGLTSIALGAEAVASGAGQRDGIPAGMFLLFGTVSLIGGVGDLRMLRTGALQGARRLSRHLWRMCFALWIATASFFLGQADEFPEAIRIPALLATPVLAVLVVMFYWLWKVRSRKANRLIPEAGSRQAARS